MEMVMCILKRVELFGEYVDRWWAWGTHILDILKYFKQLMARTLF